MKKNCTACHLRFFAVLRMTMVLVVLSPLVSAATVTPISMTDIARCGLPMLIDTITTDVEMDVPLLAPDGNILHLLGTAHPRALANTAFAEVSADLVGVTQPECTAHVEVLIDATTRRSLAQKLKMTCLGRTIHDAFVTNPPLPLGEGRGEGALQ